MRERPAPVYLDHNATSPMRPAVIAAMADAFELVGNPSSVHGFGRDARRALERARRIVGDAFSAQAGNVVFTSGGTEANNLALAQADGPILTSAIEHPSVLEAVDAIRIKAAVAGTVDLADLADRLHSTAPVLVSVMLANNETGVVQPIEQVADLVRGTGALLHVDAVQGPGKIDVDIGRIGADFLSVSAHKIGGPRGVGALIARDGVEPKAILRGGGQERRRRAGTENLPGIVGFAAAFEACGSDEPARFARLRDSLERRTEKSCPDAVIIAKAGERLPNTTCVALPGVASETQLIALDLGGIAVSAGAACSSGKVAGSHVLEAMGLGDMLTGSAIRVSLGWNTGIEDVDRFVTVWSDMAARLGGRAVTPQ